MRSLVALPAWIPDQSANSGGLNVCTNVYPRIDGYGPVQDFVAIGSALPAAFAGGGAFIGSDSASTMLVGTTTSLCKYDAGAWTAIASGLTINGRWQFVPWGDVVVSVNGVATKQITISGGVVSNITGAPSGTSIAVVGDYIVIGQNAGDILGVYTSGFNDHTDWDYTSPTSTATYQPMLSGGEVMGLAGGEYGVILQRQRLMRMTRTGDSNAPFSYDEISPNIGCASKGSIAQAGRQVFFLSDRGFMVLSDGQAVEPIGSEKVDRWFRDKVAREDFEKLWATVDPQRKIVAWSFPGTPGFILIYHYELQRWSLIELPIDGVFSAFTASMTLEQVSAIYTNIDTMPYSLDDPRFSGGAPRFYVSQNATIGALTGLNLAAAFEYSFNQFTPGFVSRFRHIRPVTDCVVGNDVAIDVRARMGDPASVVSASGMQRSGVMPVRAAGRYCKPQWRIAAGSDWSFAQGLEFEFEQGGAR